MLHVLHWVLDIRKKPSTFSLLYLYLERYFFDWTFWNEIRKVEFIKLKKLFRDWKIKLIGTPLKFKVGVRIKVVSPRWDFSWYSERVFMAHFLFWSQFSSHEKGAKNILARVCAMANGSCLVLGQGYTIWTIEYIHWIQFFIIISKK